MAAPPPSKTDPADAGFAYSVRAHGAATARAFEVAAWDLSTGAMLGRCDIAATADGSPPPLTPADLLERFGGRYRLEAVRVDAALAQIAVVSERLARFHAKQRRAARRWRSR